MITRQLRKQFGGLSIFSKISRSFKHDTQESVFIPLFDKFMIPYMKIPVMNTSNPSMYPNVGEQSKGISCSKLHLDFIIVICALDMTNQRLLHKRRP